MLSGILRRLFGATPTAQVAPVLANTNAGPAHNSPRLPSATPAAPVYPPTDQGIAYIPAQAVIDSQSEMIRRLRLLAGTDDANFDLLYMTVIRNMAEHINQLPATETGTHNGPGGLFRLALEIAFYSLQASEAVIFSGREGAEKRRTIEPRWRYATFLAGICIELHRPTTSMIVVAGEGKEWPAFQVSLGAWLAQMKTDRFYIRWLANSASLGSTGQGAASYMVYKIVPESCLQYLHEASNKIVPTMLDAIMGTVAPNSTSPIFRILNEVKNKVLKRDEAIRPANYGRVTIGTHLEPHLLDAMRRLLKDGTWKINEKKARLWYAEDGLFLVWKTAAREMIELLERDGVKGIPKDNQTLLEVLLKTNVFRLDADGSPYWSILPPTASSELIAIRFSDPLTLFGESLEEPVPVKALLVENLPKEPSTRPADEVAEQKVESVVSNSEGTVSSGAIDTETGEVLPAVATEPQKAPRKRTSNGDSQQLEQAVPAAPAKSAMGLPEDLQALFTPLTRSVIGCLLEDHLEGKTRGETGKVENGFAITLERLSDYGADAIAVIAELLKAGWLYTPAEKPNKKIHQIRLNNKDCQAVIIKQSAARDAGFVKAVETGGVAS